MRRAIIFIQDIKAAELIEHSRESYEVKYEASYKGSPISLALPVKKKIFSFNRFPPFFEGLLPEGSMLEALLKIKKIDRYDYFSQLIAVGEDLVGYVTVRILNE